MRRGGGSSTVGRRILGLDPKGVICNGVSAAISSLVNSDITAMPRQQFLQKREAEILPHHDLDEHKSGIVIDEKKM